MKLRYSAVPALLAAVFAAASLPAAARSQMQCRHVQSEGIESTYRCEAPGATIAQAYADFQARRYRYEAPVIDGVREEEIYQDGYLPHTLPKRSLKREGTEPNGCGGFRYYYHITRHNGGASAPNNSSLKATSAFRLLCAIRKTSENGSKAAFLRTLKNGFQAA